jgi:hypothetical protein
MNKAELDEAVNFSYLSDSGINCSDLHAQYILYAAKKYADLLLHLEALRGLVEDGEDATQSESFEDGHRIKVRYNVKPGVSITDAATTRRFVVTAANTRPTLSAIVKILEG